MCTEVLKLSFLAKFVMFENWTIFYIFYIMSWDPGNSENSTELHPMLREIRNCNPNKK